MVKLDLRQNALHTLHHAIEHMSWADAPEAHRDGHAFDDESHSVEWRDEHGHLCFNASSFTRLPPSYGRKFALLHLIQAVELLLKTYAEGTEPAALFVRKGSRRTIGIREALHFTLERHSYLLSPDEVSLLLESKDIRNEIEHCQFYCADSKLRSLCVDFLALCAFLSQKLLATNLVEAFSWDYLRDEPDPVGVHLSALLSDASQVGRLSAAKAGALWAAENPSERVFLCLNCGARSVSAAQGTCMGCGVEGNERASQLVEELEQFALQVNALNANQSKKQG